MKQNRQSTKGYRGEKWSKDTASSRNLVSTIGAQASPTIGDGQIIVNYSHCTGTNGTPRDITIRHFNAGQTILVSLLRVRTEDGWPLQVPVHMYPAPHTHDPRHCPVQILNLK